MNLGYNVHGYTKEKWLYYDFDHSNIGLTFGFQISCTSSEKVDDVEMFSDVEHDLDLGHEGRQVVPVHRRVGHLDGDRQDVVAFTDPDRFSFELFYN